VMLQSPTAFNLKGRKGTMEPIKRYKLNTPGSNWPPRCFAFLLARSHAAIFRTYRSGILRGALFPSSGSVCLVYLGG
jgi:hypothetical protein